MNTCLLPSLLGAAALAVLASTVPAHGGMYRGPADVVPPSPDGGRPPGPKGAGSPPITGGPRNPSAPVPANPAGRGPITPRSGSPVPGAPRGRTTGGIDLAPDLSTWEYWWEFNKDSYLKLKDAVHRTGPITGSEDIWMGPRLHREETLRPTREQVRDEILPALHRAIESTEQRDIASSCMIAMAKIGVDHPEFALVDVFRKRLLRPDQEIRETAALALGIAARVDRGEPDLLIGLARDTASGRAAYGGEVDVRTRAFAIYGLGLLAHEHRDLATKRRVFTELQAILADRSHSHRDLGVAAIQAIGLLAPGDSNAEERQLQADAVACLEHFFGQPLGAGQELVQAHCPTALAKLVGRTGPASTRCKERFAAELRSTERAQRRGSDIHRSCVLALGQLCAPHEDAGSPDAAHSLLLWQTWQDHRDDQTRNFAVLALGQIGGAANRTLLLDGLPKAGKALGRPWFALALGVLAHARREAQARTGGEVGEDRLLGERLAEQFDQATEPGLTAALAVALGLAHHQDAAPALLRRLQGDPQKEEQAGYLCLGLALMDARTALEPLRATVAQATRRPELLKQSAIALGLLGDKQATVALQQQLAEDQGNLATFAALSNALGLIGDRGSVQPLLRLLADERRLDLSRAFAAVALGGIADRAPMPWYAKVAANLNYRASVETLTNQQSGILDIL